MEAELMILVGCDLHTRKQQVALLNTATGELRNQELSHIGDDVERFYGALSPPVTVGIESTGYSLWFHALLRWVLGQAAPLATRGDAALKRIYFAVLRRRGRPKAKVALARRTREKRYATSSTASPAALIAVSNLQICIPVASSQWQNSPSGSPSFTTSCFLRSPAQMDRSSAKSQRGKTSLSTTPVSLSRAKAATKPWSVVINCPTAAREFESRSPDRSSM